MGEMLSLMIIWLTIFIAHYAAYKTKLTPVLWFLFLGCLFVNLGWLPVQPGPFIKSFSDVGLIVIMFALGFEENSSYFVKSIKTSWGIALFGAVVPFCVVYCASIYFWNDTGGALMCALAMTATAVTLAMMSLRSEKLQNSRIATGIMTAAVLDDVASLALVAILVPMATGTTEVTLVNILLIVLKALAFFVIITAMAIWLLPLDSALSKKIPLLSRFNLRVFITFQHGEHATLFMLLLAISVAILGYQFGFHPAVGAYMAGLILKEEYFAFGTLEDGKKNSIYLETKRVIDSIAFSWIGPVFFIVLGTKLLLSAEIFFAVISQVITLYILLFTGQVLSAGLAARFTGGFSWPESWMIGFGMVGRAELSFVVMNIAYIQHQIITSEMFYTLVLTAFLLNLSVPLCVRWWKPYLNKKSMKIEKPSVTKV